MLDMTQTLGEVIRERLAELGLNQTDLANRTGMTPSHISRLVSGDRGATLDSLIAIADALGIERDALMKIAAGERYEKPEEEEDPWVVEMNYKINLLTRPHIRRIAEAMLQRLVDEEQATENLGDTKPRQRPAT